MELDDGEGYVCSGNCLFNTRCLTHLRTIDLPHAPPPPLRRIPPRLPLSLSVLYRSYSYPPNPSPLCGESSLSRATASQCRDGMFRLHLRLSVRCLGASGAALLHRGEPCVRHPPSLWMEWYSTAQSCGVDCIARLHCEVSQKVNGGVR